MVMAMMIIMWPCRHPDLIACMVMAMMSFIMWPHRHPDLIACMAMEMMIIMWPLQTT
jgi:hypothetical protein